MMQNLVIVERILGWFERPEMQTIALAIIILGAIIVVGIVLLLYCVLLYAHHAIELAFHSFLELVNVIKAELSGRISHPAIRVERILLILSFVGILASLLLLMIGKHFHLHSYQAYSVVLAFLVIFVIVCIQSGSYARHFIR